MNDIPCMILRGKSNHLYIYESAAERDEYTAGNNAYIEDVKTWGYTVDPRWVAPICEVATFSMDRLCELDLAPHEIHYVNGDGAGWCSSLPTHRSAKAIVDDYLAHHVSGAAMAREVEWKQNMEAIFGGCV